MSWQSTISYYRYLNEGAAARLGGRHSADIRLWSGDFEPLARATAERDWDLTSRVLSQAARQLVTGGAEILVIAANTAHVVADEIEAGAGVPVVNIIDVTARRLEEAGVRRAALLGTAAVMEGGFYVERMADNGIRCDVPDEKRRTEIDRIIFDELVHGVVDDGSHRSLVDTIDVMSDRGAEGVILGCTELSLILDEDDGRVPGFDTTRIHCEAAVAAAFD
jgi:aspartate racemase